MSLLPTLLTALAAAAFAAGSFTARPDCQASCGGMDIPYPFGIGPGCFRKGFEIVCASNVPVLANTSIQIPVLNLSIPSNQALVKLPVGWECYNSSDDKIYDWNPGTVNVNPVGVYRISNTSNHLVVIGCNTLGYIQNQWGQGGDYPYAYYTGCMSFCNNSESAQDDACAGVGCCHVDIPPGLTDNSVTFKPYKHVGRMDFSPCDYAFLVDRDFYKFRKSDLKMDHNRKMPVWLDWAMRGNGSSLSCADPVKNSDDYACKSPISECVNSTNGPGYLCSCSKGYEGNPYIENGCTDIDECTRPDEYHCFGVCRNTPGSHECTCPEGMRGNATIAPCAPNFPLAARLALGITLGISFLIVALLLTLMVLQKRRLREFFKKNGGPILQKVDNIKIFTKEELKSITKNYSHILGKGGFGEVYKGTLDDGRFVAVKTSIEVNEARKDEFANEVIIQSRISHKNIVRLLGCCLEVDVPMLVYEYVAKGNLHNILHGNNNRQLSLPLGLRLDIAIASAEALAYMHSSVSRIILHGDVKPANILLDDNFMPKISDFGTSKQLSSEKAHTIFVVGSMGYIDPIFHQTGLLTQKSDVYSFGVILLEIITRKPALYDENSSLVIEFVKAYTKENSGKEMFDKEIAIGEDIVLLEEISRLAIECLKLNVDERPEMKEVAERLVILRRARKAVQGSYKSSHFEEISTDSVPTSFATDVSGGDSSKLSLLSNPGSKDLPEP